MRGNANKHALKSVIVDKSFGAGSVVVKAEKACLRGVRTSYTAVRHMKPVRKQGYCFCDMLSVACGFRILFRIQQSVAVKTLPPAFGLGGSGACPKPNGSKAIAIVCIRFLNSQSTRGKSLGGLFLLVLRKGVNHA